MPLRPNRVVAVPVVDLRREPIPPSIDPPVMDSLQLTQLLMGEVVELISEFQGFSQVRALMQPHWDGSRWGGYQGWVESTALVESFGWKPDRVVVERWIDCQGYRLSWGSLLMAQGDCFLLPSGQSVRLSEDAMQIYPCQPVLKRLINSALRFCGDPYFWGGCSSYHPDQSRRGVDCSSLFHLAYRQEGICLPRDSAHQLMWCQKVDRKSLALGDLLFYPDSHRPKQIGHVALYLGGGRALEASLSANLVREIDVKRDIAAVGRMADLGLPV